MTDDQPGVRASARAFVQKATQSIIDPLRTLLFGHEISTQHYSHADISPYFWVNGRPPKEESFLAMARDNFATYSLEIGGLVKRQLHLTLADLRAMPKQTQITKHCCIQGWSGVAEWGGVPLPSHTRIVPSTSRRPLHRFLRVRR